MCYFFLSRLYLISSGNHFALAVYLRKVIHFPNGAVNNLRQDKLLYFLLFSGAEIEVFRTATFCRIVAPFLICLHNAENSADAWLILQLELLEAQKQQPQMQTGTVQLLLILT